MTMTTTQELVRGLYHAIVCGAHVLSIGVALLLVSAGGLLLLGWATPRVKT